MREPTRTDRLLAAQLVEEMERMVRQYCRRGTLEIGGPVRRDALRLCQTYDLYCPDGDRRILDNTTIATDGEHETHEHAET